MTVQGPTRAVLMSDVTSISKIKLQSNTMCMVLNQCWWYKSIRTFFLGLLRYIDIYIQMRYMISVIISVLFNVWLQYLPSVFHKAMPVFASFITCTLCAWPHSVTSFLTAWCQTQCRSTRGTERGDTVECLDVQGCSARVKWYKNVSFYNMVDEQQNQHSCIICHAGDENL